MSPGGERSLSAEEHLDLAFGGLTPLPAEESRPGAGAGDTEDTAGAGNPVTNDSWHGRSLLEINANPPEPPTLVRGENGEALLYRGIPQMISGLPESGKSWLACIAADEVLNDGESVLWIDTDGAGAGDLLERLRALGVADSVIDARFRYVAPDGPAPRERLTRECEEVRPALIVWDAFGPALGLLGLDANSEADIERFRRTALGIWPGATELLLDHVVKDPEKRNGMATGSQRKQGLVHVHIQLEAKEKPSREQAGRITLRATKDRPAWHKRGHGGYVGELSIVPNGVGVTYALTLGRDSGGGGGFRPTALMERVSRFLEIAGKPQNQAQVLREVAGRNEHLRTAIQCLAEDGFVRVDPGPHGANMMSVEQVYRDGVNA